MAKTVTWSFFQEASLSSCYQRKGNALDIIHSLLFPVGGVISQQLSSTMMKEGKGIEVKFKTNQIKSIHLATAV